MGVRWKKHVKIIENKYIRTSRSHRKIQQQQSTPLSLPLPHLTPLPHFQLFHSSHFLLQGYTFISSLSEPLQIQSSSSKKSKFFKKKSISIRAPKVELSIIYRRVFKDLVNISKYSS